MWEGRQLSVFFSWLKVILAGTMYETFRNLIFHPGFITLSQKCFPSHQVSCVWNPMPARKWYRHHFNFHWISKKELLRNMIQISLCPSELKLSCFSRARQHSHCDYLQTLFKIQDLAVSILPAAILCAWVEALSQRSELKGWETHREHRVDSLWEPSGAVAVTVLFFFFFLKRGQITAHCHMPPPSAALRKITHSSWAERSSLPPLPSCPLKASPRRHAVSSWMLSEAVQWYNTLMSCGVKHQLTPKWKFTCFFIYSPVDLTKIFCSSIFSITWNPKIL